MISSPRSHTWGRRTTTDRVDMSALLLLPMGCDEKRFMAQMHLELVLRHLQKGVILMASTALRLV